MKPQKHLIYSHHWDVLVILDACRADYFEQVVLPRLKAEGYRVVTYEVVKSAGSCTQEWFIRSFDRPLKDVVYVSGNPYVRHGVVTAFDGQTRYNPSQIFSKIVDAWRVCWRRITGVWHVDPACVTNLATLQAILRPKHRVIVHYMQPHAPYPFIPELRPYFTRDISAPDWDLWVALQRGKVRKELVIAGYVSNLRWVLRYLLSFLSWFMSRRRNLRIVITADHGEVFGECGYVDHPCGVDIPQLRHVPWCVVEV